VSEDLKLSIPHDLHTVFLDRDGILNQKMPEGKYVMRWDEFHILPGVPAAVRRLNGAGLRVIVVTNQRGIARGLYTIDQVEDIHAAFQKGLAAEGAHIDAFLVCPHDDRQCNCRKPLPGLFEQAVARFPSITPATSIMIGDSLSDIEFGHRLGMTTIYIEVAAERRSPHAEQAASLADLCCNSLTGAADVLLCGFNPG
jgi:D-glycero-D-manno-heptose 1,7-bisphosphate phosphatase